VNIGQLREFIGRMSFADAAQRSSELRAPLIVGSGAGDRSPLERIPVNIGQLREFIGRIRIDVEKLGTDADTDSLRNQLRTERNEALEVVNATRALFQQPYDRADKTKHDMLTNQFKALLDDYKRITELSLRKEKEFVARKRAESSRRATILAQGAQPQQQVQQLRELKEAEDVDNRIIAERNAEIKEVERDLEELAGVFKEMNQIVGEQGEVLNTAEAQTAASSAQVESGTLELKKADEYQQSARKKMLIIAGIVCCVIVVIAIIIVVSIRPWSH